MKIMLSTMFLAVLLSCTNHNSNEISASGTIEATEVTISAKVGGDVIDIFAEEGKNVQKGDTLAIIDHADLEIQRRQAEANAASAEAQYQMLLRGAREEDLIQAEATLVNAESDLKRLQSLFQEGTITQKQLDDVQTRYTVAKQAYDKLKKGARPEELQSARGRRDQAVAQVEAVSKKIKDSYVISPLNGVVTLKAVEVGESVLPSSSMFRVTELSKVHLMIYVTEIELAKVQLGQKTSVVIDAQQDQSVEGTVTYISPVAEFTPKNVQTKDDRTKLVFGVKIEVQNPDRMLKPGMPADATIQLQ